VPKNAKKRQTTQNQKSTTAKHNQIGGYDGAFSMKSEAAPNMANHQIHHRVLHLGMHIIVVQNSKKLP